MTDSIKSICLRRRMMRLRLAILAMVVVLISAADTFAAWGVEIESKAVSAGATNVTLDFTAFWDIGMTAFTLPVVVRGIDPGAFWTGTLPYDTDGNAYEHPYAHGVTWKWPDPSWAIAIEEVRPGLGCDPEGDTGYDGVSPDHFVVNAVGYHALSAESSGWTILTIEFDVTSTPGSFEFDTACFTDHLPAIFMVDDVDCGTNHGPIGLNDATFTQGVITIAESPCYCGAKGDMDNSGGVGNPLDVSFLVKYVFQQQDARVYPTNWNCPFDLGDMDCGGGVNPLDVAYLVKFVFQQQDAICDGCNP